MSHDSVGQKAPERVWRTQGENANDPHGFSDGTDHVLDIPTMSDGTGKTTATNISAIVDGSDDGEVGDKLVSISNPNPNPNP